MPLCCMNQHLNSFEKTWCVECGSLVVGTHIGDYTVLSYLGQGSSSAIYLAHEHTHSRKVVIKVLQSITSEESIEAFQREATLLSSLVHRYILPIYAHGVISHPRTIAGGVHRYSPYLVLPYAEQGALDAIFAREGNKPWPLERVLPIIEDAAEALEYAHSRGVLHRDIKPANILLMGAHGVVSDFGVAVLIDADSSHMSVIWAGSPAYMAPEVWSLRPGRYSDQYALAVTCYRLLSGEYPWQRNIGNTVSWSNTHHYVAPRSLRMFRPDIPMGVCLVLQKALAKDPHDRYNSVRAFATDLRVASADETQVLVKAMVAGTMRENTPSSTASIRPSALLAVRPTASHSLFADISTTPDLPATESEAVNDWHFERVSTTLVNARRQRWIRGAFLLNLLLCVLLSFIPVLTGGGIVAAAQLSLFLFPAILVGPLVSYPFRGLVFSSNAWRILAGMLFGIMNALLSGVVCSGWAALLLTLPHWAHEWKHAGDGLHIFLQQLTEIGQSTGFLLLLLLGLWLAVFGGAIIGLSAAKAERAERMM